MLSRTKCEHGRTLPTITGLVAGGPDRISATLETVGVAGTGPTITARGRGLLGHGGDVGYEKSAPKGARLTRARFRRS